MIFIRSYVRVVILTIGFLGFFFSSAWAGEGGPALSTIELKVPEQKVSTEYKKEASGNLDIVGESYPSPVPEDPKLSQGLLVRAHIKPQLKTENTQSLMDLTVQRYTNWGSSGYSVKELYWSKIWRDGRSQFTLGRKNEFWSQVDLDWKLGLWQPNSTLDSLRPEEQGLTGIFYRHQEGKFEFLSVLSPMFVPTMGPQIREENGNIVADSRWYRSPSPNFLIFNQQRRVVYQLNTPDLMDLVKRPGFGIRWSYGKDEPGSWISASLGYKPINSLLVKYDRKLLLSEEGQDTGTAPVFPAVSYHSIWGTDVGYRWGQNAVSFSYLEDEPVNTTPDDPYIVQFVNPMRSYSVHAETKIPMIGLENPLQISLGYLKIDGGDYHDVDSEGHPQGAVFNQRFNFYNAALLSAQYETVFFHKKTLSKLSYMREFDQKGMIATAALDFYPTASWAVTLGADILGVDDSSANNLDTGFLNQFRANDRFYAGMSYVF
jgi:hypothetical protein